MQKGFPLILIVLIVVAVGGYFLYQQQNKSTPSTPPAQTVTQPSSTSKETANWKTYTNTIDGYSIKYPTDWIVDDTCMVDKQCVGGISASIKSPEKFTLNEQNIMSYSIKIFKSDKDPRDTTGQITGYNPPGGYKEYKINNIDVLESIGMNGTLEFSLKKSVNYYIYISFLSYSKKTPFPEQERFLKTFNQILSTFRFQ